MIPKFRVWVKSESRMIDSENIASLDFLKKQIAESKISANKDGSLGVVEYMYHNFDDIELMQSTRIKDNYCVEIYEGDVIEWIYSVDEYENQWGKYEVKEFNGAFRLAHSYEEVLYEFTEWVDEYYVVGNVYENPELLEDTNETRKRYGI